jgi:chromosome segregation ATPase
MQSSIDPVIRSAWAETLQETQDELAAIDADMEQLVRQLNRALAQEQFISLRTQSYQRRLNQMAEEEEEEEEEAAEVLSPEENDDGATDVEMGGATPVERHRAALAAVRQSHLELLASCVEMQRRLHALQERREELRQQDWYAVTVEEESAAPRDEEEATSGPSSSSPHEEEEEEHPPVEMSTRQATPDPEVLPLSDDDPVVRPNTPSDLPPPKEP